MTPLVFRQYPAAIVKYAGTIRPAQFLKALDVWASEIAGNLFLLSISSVTLVVTYSFRWLKQIKEPFELPR